MGTEHRQAAHELDLAVSLVLTQPQAATSLGQLANSPRIHPEGALVLGALLQVTGRWEAAQFWWEFAAGAGSYTAASCLDLLHRSRAEFEDADLWRDRAEAMADEPRPIAVPAAFVGSLLPTHVRNDIIARCHEGLDIHLPARIAAAIHQLPVAEDDEEYGEIPQPDPSLLPALTATDPARSDESVPWHDPHRRLREDTSTAADPGCEVTLDIHRPHSARVNDYFLGGTTNFEPDRDLAAMLLALLPSAPVAAQANRAFMRRTTRMLAQRGITQFLEVGIGIPDSPDLHEVAQEVDPACRVVYADNDAIVLTHGQALLRSTPEGRIRLIQADVRDPEHVLDAVENVGTIDLSRPVALSMVGLLHFVPDNDRVYAIAQAFRQRLCPGSALVVSHLTPDFAPAAVAHAARTYTAWGMPVRARTGTEIARLFTGWNLVDPGIVAASRWRPDADRNAVSDAQASHYGAVGVRP
ncbi:SAM-dependent methyltransferase [Kitasatospora sp. NPDC092948]|uniref:SAM-dependent methyltransferase n=1 Tax=Kitasatospora sp. NPDC092948 TaxID=3364088 RepID=UPI0038198822